MVWADAPRAETEKRKARGGINRGGSDVARLS